MSNAALSYTAGRRGFPNLSRRPPLALECDCRSFADRGWSRGNPFTTAGNREQDR